jgi:hypothetical protein
MPRVAASVVIDVPPALCVQSVQDALADERLAAAYRALRPGRGEYSGWVTSLVPERRVEIAFAALDPATKRRSERSGWRVIYEFLPTDDGRTLAEVSIEYGVLAALGGAGTMRAQAEGHILLRLSALVTLELGARAGAGAR